MLILWLACGPVLAATDPLGAALENRDLAQALQLWPAQREVWLSVPSSRAEEAIAALVQIAERITDLAGADERGWEAAESALRAAQEWRERRFGTSSLQTAQGLTMLSDLAFTRGRFQQAERLERSSLALRRALGSSSVATSLEGVGLCLLQQGKPGDAEPLLEEAVQLHRRQQPPDSESLTEALNSLAECLRLRTDFDSSESSFREALALTQASGEASNARAARVANNLAGLLKDQGRLAEAETLLRQSLSWREANAGQDPVALAVGLLNLAELLRLEGEGNDAEALYRRSLSVAESALGAEHPDLVPHLAQLAVLLAEQDRASESEALFTRALSVAEKSSGPEHPIVAQIAHDQARALMSRGRIAAALLLLQRALAIRTLVFGAEHFDTALTELELAKALRASGKPVESRTHAATAVNALAILRAYPESHADALGLLAELDRAKGDRALAERELRAAIEIVEGLRPESGGGERARAELVARHASLYAGLAGLLASNGDVAGAFAVAESGRARVLLDRLTTSGVDLRAGLASDQRERLLKRERDATQRFAAAQQRAAALPYQSDLDERERRTQVDQARQALDRAAAEYRDTQRELANASPVWRGVSGGESLRLAAAQQRFVERRGGMLDYIVGVDEAWLLWIPPAPRPALALSLTVSASAAETLGIASGPLNAARLATALGGLGGVAESLRQPPIRGLQASPAATDPALIDQLQALADVLLPPLVRKALDPRGVVTVLPDAALHALPFEALVLSRTRDGAPSYWLDAGPAIRYATSARLLQAIVERQREPAATKLLSVTAPQFASDGERSRFASLAGAAREGDAVINAVAKRLPSASIESLRGEQAREPAVRTALPKAQWVHIATHGFVDQHHGESFAGLALTPPLKSTAVQSSDDGLLQLFELYDLPLHADLVVLSACSTGEGDAVAGEGVLALSRAFVASGARRVIATQWTVDDDSTAALVAGLFDSLAAAELKGQSLDVAIALRNAKRSVRGQSRWASPYYWAPFVLIGPR